MTPPRITGTSHALLFPPSCAASGTGRGEWGVVPTSNKSHGMERANVRSSHYRDQSLVDPELR